MKKATAYSLVASIGVVVTALLAVKCSKKIEEGDNIKSKIKKYIPAVVSGSVTIAAVMRADSINRGELAIVAASAANVVKVASRNKTTNEDMPIFIDGYSGSVIHGVSYQDMDILLKTCEEIYEETAYLPWSYIFAFANNYMSGSTLAQHVGWSKAMLMDYYEDEVPVKFALSKISPNKFLISYSVEPDWGFDEY